MTGTIRLLYAEDNPFDADLTLRHFEREAPELHLEAVSSGKECLERLGKQTFDLLLLDYHLGDTDGIALLTSLRAAGNAVPVVMLTGAGDDSSIERALRAGADDYVVKSRIHLMSLPDRARSLIARLRDRASGLLAVRARPDPRGSTLRCEGARSERRAASGVATP